MRQPPMVDNKSILERVQLSSSFVSGEVKDIPELGGALAKIGFDTDSGKVGRERLLYLGQTFISYLRIVKELAQLDSSDLEIIRQANDLARSRGLLHNSTSGGGAEHFLDAFGEKRNLLVQVVSEASDVNSELFRQAVSDLATRMKKGHEISEMGLETADGASSDADYAIWGHTKPISDDAKIHLTLSHLIGRLVANKFSSDPDPQIRAVAENKDSTIEAMSDVIMLGVAKGSADPQIARVWGNTREDGGLNWNLQSRQEVYNEIVREKRT